MFRSPSFRYKVRDLCLHILSSFPMSTLIAFWICTTRSEFPICNANFFAQANSFLFFSNSFLTLPKHFWLHQVSSLPQFYIFLSTRWLSPSSWLASQTPSTVSPHPLSANHIYSNLNGFFFCWNSRPACSFHRVYDPKSYYPYDVPKYPENPKTIQPWLQPYLVSPKLTHRYDNVCST